MYLVLEPVPQYCQHPPSLLLDARCAYAPHWYDLKCLFEKRWSAAMSFDVQVLLHSLQPLISVNYDETGTVSWLEKYYSACVFWCVRDEEELFAADEETV